MTNESHNEGICIVLIVGMLFYFNYYDQKQLKEEKERKIEKEYFMNEINHLKLTIVELEKKIKKINGQKETQQTQTQTETQTETETVKQQVLFDDDGEIIDKYKDVTWEEDYTPEDYTQYYKFVYNSLENDTDDSFKPRSLKIGESVHAVSYNKL